MAPVRAASELARVDLEAAKGVLDGDQAVARHSRRGWRLDKPERETKIDAVVALAMAVDRAEHREEPARLVGWL